MLALLLPIVVAVAAADYTVPIYENPDIVVPQDQSRSTCFYDCHQHLLRYGTYVVYRDVLDQEPTFTSTYAPFGINGLQQPDLTKLRAVLDKQDHVGILYSYNNFQSELFPGALDTRLVIPEHLTTFKVLQLEHPILVLLTKEQFNKIKVKEEFKRIADLGVSDKGFYIAKDFSIFVRALPQKNKRVGFNIHVNA